MMSEEIANKIAIFQSKAIRLQLYNGEWWFVLIDVISALTDSRDPSQYLKRIRSRDTELSAIMSDKTVDKRGGTVCTPPCTNFQYRRWQSQLSTKQT